MIIRAFKGFFLLSLSLTLILLSASGYSQTNQAQTDQAQNFGVQNFGLAMHGAPLHNKGDIALGYVNADAPKGGTLKQAAIGTFDSLNPYAIKGKAAQGLHLVYDRLMQRAWDEPFTLYPLIAQSYDIPDDRSSITFTLNPEARFHDGTPITTDDVLFSFETLREYGRPNMRRIYDLVASTDKIDTNRIAFILGNGFDRETVMIIAMMPVLSKAWWEGRTFDSAILETPLGNGAYKIEDIDAGRRIVYSRLPDYWAKDLMINRGQHNFDTIIYDYYRDDTVALEAFQSGDLNFRREGNAGNWNRAYDEALMERSGLIKLESPHARPESVRALIFNTRRAPFDDIKVREALNQVLDFKWINENLYHGQYKRVDSYYPNSALSAPLEPTEAELALLAPFTDSLPPRIFGAKWTPPYYNDNNARRAGLRKADALLKEAGWLIEDGLRKKDGEAFAFEILLGAPEDEKLALSFVSALKRLGIEANIRVLDSAAFRGRLNEYDYDMVAYRWQNSLSPGTEQMLYWSCESAQMPARWNFAGVCEPAIDALAGGIANAQDYEALKAHAHAIDRIMMHGHYMIPLYYAGVDYIAHHKTLQSPPNTPIYGAVIESWWVQNEENDVQE